MPLSKHCQGVACPGDVRSPAGTRTRLEARRGRERVVVEIYRPLERAEA